MPANVVKTPEEEKLWERAKVEAHKKFKKETPAFFAYTMTIFENMKGGSKKK